MPSPIPPTRSAVTRSQTKNSQSKERDTSSQSNDIPAPPKRSSPETNEELESSGGGEQEYKGPGPKSKKAKADNLDLNSWQPQTFAEFTRERQAKADALHENDSKESASKDAPPNEEGIVFNRTGYPGKRENRCPDDALEES